MKKKVLNIQNILLFTLLLLLIFSFKEVLAANVILNKPLYGFKGETIVLKSALKGTTKWTSSNSSIATVDKTGKVKGKKEGTVTITAKNGSKTDTVKLTILKGKTDITKKWETLQPKSYKTSDSVFAVKPSVRAPYSAGKLTSIAEQNGLGVLNFARYLAGLNSNVKIDANYRKQAGNAAVLLQAAREFSHYPSKPSNMKQDFYETGYSGTSKSNLAAQSWNFTNPGVLPFAILDYLDDYDVKNLGHRYWVLSSRMGKTGFGVATKDANSNFLWTTTSSMYAIDNSAKNKFNTINWPTEGYFPIEMLGNRTPTSSKGYRWNVVLNPEVYSTGNNQNITVKVYKVNSDGSIKLRDTIKTKSYWYSYSDYGFDFEPNIPASEYTKKGTYRIVVSGLKLKNGKSTTYTYETHFFHMIKPKNLKATSASYNSIKLSWSKVRNATEYTIYRATSKTGKYKQIGTTKSASYTDKKLKTGKNYFYKIVANTPFGTSDYSAIVNTKPIPKKPSLTAKKASKTSVKNTWKKVSGASGYQIQMKTGSGKYVTIKTIKTGNTVNYTKTKLKKNTKYQFRIRAYRIVDGKKVYSSYSSVKTVKL